MKIIQKHLEVYDNITDMRQVLTQQILNPLYSLQKQQESLLMVIIQNMLK